MSQLLVFIEENWKTITGLSGAVWFILITLLVGAGAIMWKVLQMIAKGQIDGLNSSISSLKERLEHRDEEIKRLKERLAEAQGNSTQRDGRIEALEAEIRGRDERIEAYEVEAKTRDGQIVDLTSELNAARANLEEIKKRSKSFEVEAVALKPVAEPLIKRPLVLAPQSSSGGRSKKFTHGANKRGGEREPVITPSTPVDTPRSLLNPDGGRAQVRQLNPRQIHTLTSVLKESGGPVVIAKMGGADSHGLMLEDLRRAFNAAGWNVIVGHLDGGYRSRTGLALCVNDPHNMTARQVLVSQALRDADIPHDLTRGDSEVEVSLWIME